MRQQNTTSKKIKNIFNLRSIFKTPLLSIEHSRISNGILWFSVAHRKWGKLERLHSEMHCIIIDFLGTPFEYKLRLWNHTAKVLFDSTIALCVLHINLHWVWRMTYDTQLNCSISHLNRLLNKIKICDSRCGVWKISMLWWESRVREFRLE